MIGMGVETVLTEVTRILQSVIIKHNYPAFDLFFLYPYYITEGKGLTIISF